MSAEPAAQPPGKPDIFSANVNAVVPFGVIDRSTVPLSGNSCAWKVPCQVPATSCGLNPGAGAGGGGGGLGVGATRLTNQAEALSTAAATVSEHRSFVPVQAPDHFLKRQPRAGTADSVTDDPAFGAAAHFPGQPIAPAAPTTFPLPWMTTFTVGGGGD